MASIFMLSQLIMFSIFDEDYMYIVNEYLIIITYKLLNL